MRLALTVLRIPNRQARWLWLETQGLSKAPTGALDLCDLITRLGFVQLDTIQVIARAHHHIIWSRNQNYREPMLNDLLANDRAIFEHFTHDASVLPMEFLPMWRRQFTRYAEKISAAGWWKRMPDAAGRAEIKARIAAEGPLSTQAFHTKVEGPKKMWQRAPHKLGLDYMWYAGELATSHRVNFVKHYDLAERIFPENLREKKMPEADQVDWLCRAALTRLGVANQGEIQRFWDAMSARETKEWLAKNASDLIPVEVQAADGTWGDAWAVSDIEERLANLGPPTSRMRILNPFDPVIRDRARLERLFGFEYRVEMFVPAAKRKYGYYVYPVLENDRFIGRVEARANRAKSTITLDKVWREQGVTWTPARDVKLQAELERMARFIGVDTVEGVNCR